MQTDEALISATPSPVKQAEKVRSTVLRETADILLEQVGDEARYWITDKSGFTAGYVDDRCRDIPSTRQLTRYNRDLLGWDIGNLLGRDDQTFNRNAAILLGMSMQAAQSEFPAMSDRHPRAVYALECSFDGAVPLADIEQARAIDAAFETLHPGHREVFPSEIDEARLMVSYYKSKVLDLIAAKRSQDAAGVNNRLWSMSTVLMWFREWRKERRRMLALQQAS